MNAGSDFGSLFAICPREVKSLTAKRRNRKEKAASRAAFLIKRACPYSKKAGAPVAYSSSSAMAVPSPPPMHSVAKPFFRPRFFSA